MYPASQLPKELVMRYRCLRTPAWAKGVLFHFSGRGEYRVMVNEDKSVMTREGFYAVIGKDMLGVYLASDGPKMFVNKEVFDLNDLCWDVEMVMGKKSHLITFYWRGEVKFSLRSEIENDLFLSLYDYLSCRSEVKRLA